MFDSNLDAPPPMPVIPQPEPIPRTTPIADDAPAQPLEDQSYDAPDGTSAKAEPDFAAPETAGVTAADMPAQETAPQPSSEASEDEDSPVSEGDMEGHTTGTLRIFRALENLEEVVHQLSQQFAKKIDRTEYEMAALERQTKEIERYRDDLYGQIVTPLLLKIIEVADKAQLTVSYAQASGEKLDAKDLAVYVDMLREILGDYRVAPLTPEVGDRFASTSCRILNRVPTGDKSLHKTIAEVVNGGYELNGRTISPAAVRVYSYRADKDDSVPPATAADAMQDAATAAHPGADPNQIGTENDPAAE